MDAEYGATLWGVFQWLSHVHQGNFSPAIPVAVFKNCLVMRAGGREIIKEVCVDMRGEDARAIAEPGTPYEIIGRAFPIWGKVFMRPDQPVRPLTDEDLARYNDAQG